MKLYEYRYSPNARKVRAFIAELDLACEIEQVDILKGESRTPEFRRLNPNGKVPVLVDGDFILTESNAILVYLAETHAPAWLGNTPRGRADALRWMFWQTAHLGQPAAKLGFELAIKPWLKGEASDPDKASKLWTDLAPWMQVLEDQLSHREWLCASRSIADIAIGAWVEMLAEKKQLERYPAVEHWYGRLASLEGWKNTASAMPE